MFLKIRYLLEMKRQPVVERALRHKEILKEQSYLNKG